MSQCEYGKLVFTNVDLLTFSCLKKKRKLQKVTKLGQLRVGLRCLGGLSGHLTMALPLSCLIVMSD